MTHWEIREAKRQWAANNPDKVKESNRRYRAANLNTVRRQTRERMKRWRSRMAAPHS